MKYSYVKKKPRVISPANRGKVPSVNLLFGTGAAKKLLLKAGTDNQRGRIELGKIVNIIGIL